MWVTFQEGRSGGCSLRGEDQIAQPALLEEEERELALEALGLSLVSVVERQSRAVQRGGDSVPPIGATKENAPHLKKSPATKPDFLPWA